MAFATLREPRRPCRVASLGDWVLVKNPFSLQKSLLIQMLPNLPNVKIARENLFHTIMASNGMLVEICNLCQL